MVVRSASRKALRALKYGTFGTKHSFIPVQSAVTPDSYRFGQKRTVSSETVLLVLSKLSEKKSAVALAHSLLELIDTSACIYELLLTCVERVALRADVNTQAALRGRCLESLAASALYRDNLCLRMDSFFHVFHLLNQRFGA